MLRYQLYEMNGEQVPIEKEVHYLKDYMDFQQLRQDDNFSVRFDCDSKVQGFSIEPLLLIPLVENAFKHISHYNDRPNFVELKMERNNGQFSFGIRNSKEPDQVKMLHGGIGLANVRRRLELLYPDKHNFTIVENPDEFIVNLNLRLS